MRRKPLERRTPLKARTELKRDSEQIVSRRRKDAPGSKRWRNCAYCGERFYDEQARASGGQRYCSQRCFGDSLSERRQRDYPSRDQLAREYGEEGLSLAALGKRHGHTYTWAAKALKTRGVETRSQREAARRKAKPLHRLSDRKRWGIHLKPSDWCRNCGTTGVTLHLHHVIPRSKSHAAKYDLRNGLQLCGTCHAGWHRRRTVIYREIFTGEEWAFISTVELLGQSVEVWLEERYPERPADGTEITPTCTRGHKLTPENISLVRGKRRCRECATLRETRYREQKRTAPRTLSEIAQQALEISQ